MTATVRSPMPNWWGGCYGGVGSVLRAACWPARPDEGG